MFEIFKSGKGQPLCVTHLYSEYDSRGNLRRAGNKEWSLMSLFSEESYEKMINHPNSGKTVSKRLDYF